MASTSETVIGSEYDRRRCRFCDRLDSPYTCPRCNYPYCSKNCYSKPEHSQCSEMFYKDWVETHLRQSKSSPSAQKRIAEILQRVYQRKGEEEKLDSDDEDRIPDLHERLSGLDLDGDADSSIWEKLTKEEKQEFQTLIENGDIDNVLPLWKPWWRLKETTKLVQEMEESCSRNNKPLCHCPLVLEDIPLMKDLLSVIPSKNLKYHIINTLYAYAYIARFYNGDHHEFPIESAKFILNISHCLSSNQTFSNTEDAVVSAIYQLQQNTDLENSPALVIEVIDEVRCLLEGPDDKNSAYYVLAALSDVHGMMKEARNRCRRTRNTPRTTVSTKKSIKSCADKEFVTKLHHAEKKLIFYMSWTKDYQQEMQSLILELNLLHAAKLNGLVIFETQKAAVDQNLKVKNSNCAAKIEEI